MEESQSGSRQQYASLSSASSITSSLGSGAERNDNYGAVDNLTAARSSACRLSLCDHLCLPLVMLIAVVAIFGVPTAFYFLPIDSVSPPVQIITLPWLHERKRIAEAIIYLY